MNWARQKRTRFKPVRLAQFPLSLYIRPFARKTRTFCMCYIFRTPIFSQLAPTALAIHLVLFNALGAPKRNLFEPVRLPQFQVSLYIRCFARETRPFCICWILESPFFSARAYGARNTHMFPFALGAPKTNPF